MNHTVIGLTNLQGEAVICIVIFAWIEYIPLGETSLDLSVPVIGDVGDPDFFRIIVVRASISRGGNL